MSKLFVKPAIAGAMVRQPDRDMTPLPQEGAWVADTMFWQRRIMLGDVVEAPPPVEAAPAPEPVPPPPPPAAQ